MTESSRERLPKGRPCITGALERAGTKGSVTGYILTCGFYRAGRFMEIFVDDSRFGSEWQALFDDATILVSLLLHTGFPIDHLTRRQVREALGEPPALLGVLIDHAAAITRAGV